MIILKYKDIEGEEIQIGCLTNFMNEKKCKEFHRGMLGCAPDCPYYIEATEALKESVEIFLEIKGWNYLEIGEDY